MVDDDLVVSVCGWLVGGIGLVDVMNWIGLDWR